MSLMQNHRLGRLTVWASLGAMGLVGSVARAQDALRPPTSSEVPSSSKWVMMGLALLLTGAAVFVVTLKAKRGHQD